MKAGSETLVEYSVWDRTTRWFHWINVLCVITLMCIGTVILFASDLDVSNDGKIALKTLHVYVGYVFVLNLAWRLVWGFVGGLNSRWSRILPGGRGFGRELGSFIKNVRSGNMPTYSGHSPMGRIAVAVLMIALLVQGGSGLILAGTDVYMPPFGGKIAEWVASPDKEASQVRPYAPETVNQESYDEMRAFRSPVIKTHEFLYYSLMILIILHIFAVVVIEVRFGGGLISAMFTGRKTAPQDRAESRDRETGPADVE